MRTQMIAVAAAVFYLSAQSTASAQTDPKSILERFAGVWTAPPLELRLNSDFDVSVWGPNAQSVRKVEVTIQPNGEGSVTVTRSIIDGRGQVKPTSVSIEAAKLRLRLPETIDPKRLEPLVEVLNPERRYPATPGDKTALDGLVVKLIGTELENNRVNLRFDLPDGRGSFGETLVRRAPRARRSS